MTFERIRELIDYLPSTSSYFREVLNYTAQVTAVPHGNSVQSESKKADLLTWADGEIAGR